MVGHLNKKLGLQKIANKCQMKYEPRKFAAVVWKCRRPKTTLLLFNNGKIICTGAKNPEAGKRAMERICQLLKKIGYDVSLSDPKVVNVVIVGHVEKFLDLNSVAKKFNGFFEGEIFPGCFVKRDNYHATVFSSGKFVMRGLKTENDAYRAAGNLIIDLLLL